MFPSLQVQTLLFQKTLGRQPDQGAAQKSSIWVQCGLEQEPQVSVCAPTSRAVGHLKRCAGQASLSDYAGWLWEGQDHPALCGERSWELPVAPTAMVAGVEALAGLWPQTGTVPGEALAGWASVSFALALTPTFLQLVSPLGPTPGRFLSGAPSGEASGGASQCGFSTAPAPLSSRTAVTVCSGEKNGGPWTRGWRLPWRPWNRPQDSRPRQGCWASPLPPGCHEGRGAVLLSPVAPLGSLCPWHWALPGGCAPTDCSNATRPLTPFLLAQLTEAPEEPAGMGRGRLAV